MDGKESELSNVINIRSGRAGSVIGKEERGGKQYVRVKFSDHESLVPEDLFNSIYTQDANAYERERYWDLRGHIRGIRKSDDDLELGSSVYEAVRGVIKEVNDDDLLYRCDLRSPFGVRGIFQKGFTPNLRGQYAGEFISTTTSPEHALMYPDENGPASWNGIKYIYIIDPFHKDIEKGQFGEALKTAESDYLDLVKEEIDYKRIPSSAIRYALEFNEAKQSFVNIHKNPLSIPEPATEDQ